MRSERRIVLRAAALGALSLSGMVRGAGLSPVASFAAPARTVSVKAFGAKGDGSTNDRQAVLAALASSPSIVFPEGDYFLGELDQSIPAAAVNLTGAGIRLQSEGRVRLIVQTTRRAVTAVFAAVAVTDLVVGDFEIVDRGGDVEQKWTGAVGFLFVGQVGPSSGIAIGRVTARNLVAAVMVIGQSQRVWGIRIDRLTCTDCYYGINCQENGDDVAIGLVEAFGCNRSYFVYGVSRHRVRIHSVDGRRASADCLIKRYRRNTADIVVGFAARRSRVPAPHGLVVFEHQPSPGSGRGVIRDIRLDLDVDMPSTSGYAVLFRSYTADGKTDVAMTENVWDGITISGHARTGAASSVHADVGSRMRGRLIVDGHAGLVLDQSVREAFEVTTEGSIG